MWVQAGFSPDTFWDQTPRNFQLAMKGVRKRLQQESDVQLRQSYETAAFTANGMNGKLKPLRHYMTQRAGKQTGRDMLAIMRGFQARGANMTIRQVRLDRQEA